MLTETDLRKRFVEQLRKAGAKVIPYVGSTYGQSGTADIYVAHKRWSGWVEFKGPKTKIEPLQKLFQEDMLARGVNSVFVRFLDKNTYIVNENPKWFFLGTGLEILESLK